jgi:hypothetical protein
MTSTGLTRDQRNLLAELVELLREARKDPQFAEAMRPHGYDEAGWAYGEELAKRLRAAGRARAEAKSAELGTTGAYRRQLSLTWAHGRALVKACVVLFQGHTDWLQLLGLHRCRKGNGEESWIIRLQKRSPLDEIGSFLRTLYEVALSHAEMAAILARHGFPAAILIQGAAEVEALVEASVAKEVAKAAVPRVIDERDVLYEVALKWLRCTQEAAALARQTM